ncbi:hypothetical protein SIPHO067v1_p0061 [Vibrio phage 51E28.1]|nr:hypothetical protein SIPHO068v1_p0039 [Vibrio phage 51E28.4]QZI92901.1 hypothetical protein SIPHO067v1_p0061 [Vibrio phage 51E28.1]
MALLKGKTAAEAQEEMNTAAETENVETSNVDAANAAIDNAMEAEQTETEEVVETKSEPVETKPEPEVEKVETKVEAEKSPEPEKENVVKEEQIIEDAQVTEPEAEKVEKKVEAEKVETKPEPETKSEAEPEVVETKTTSVAEVEKAESTAVAPQASKAVAANQVISQAADNGFDGLELGFGSFPMIKLENEGQFADSDENELGKHIRAVLQQSTPVYLYKQENNEDGPIAYSYDRNTLTSYKGDEGEEFKTVDEIKAAWAEEGYDLEEKKYLEVVATVCEDHEEFIEGEVPEGLEDIEGETVMFRLAPASLKAFSGKVATLQMRNQPIQGATMDFLVGKKRKSNGGKTYFPWKFRLVK